MDEFPFTEEEWRTIARATTSVTNATLADDAAWRARSFRILRRRIRGMKLRYGDHPVLIETLADFHDDPQVRRRLYRRAIRIAVRHGLPAFTMRIYLARLLLEEFHDPRRALLQLQQCESEVLQSRDNDYISMWRELMSLLRD